MKFIRINKLIFIFLLIVTLIVVLFASYELVLYRLGFIKVDTSERATASNICKKLIGKNEYYVYPVCVSNVDGLVVWSCGLKKGKDKAWIRKCTEEQESGF